MKIAKIEIFLVVVPLKKKTEGAHGVISEQKSVIARVWTDNGESGLGSVDPRAKYDEDTPDEMVHILRNNLVPAVIGEDPLRIRRIVDVMDLAVPRHYGAKAAIEVALFDILGKRLGVPVHALFGGRVRDEILLNGWLGLVGPDTARLETREMLERGFRSLKIKMNADVAATVKRVEAVKSVAGNRMRLRVDANEDLNLEQATQAVQALAPFGIEYLEQPMPREKLEEFVILSRSSPVKLMADESIHDIRTLLSILKSGAAQFVKVKIQKMGGLLKTYQAIQIAEAFGIPVILGHGFGLTINTLAELHLAASTGAVVDGCESVGPIKMTDDVVKEPLIMNCGSVPVPMKAGLGVELDEAKVQKYLHR